MAPRKVSAAPWAVPSLDAWRKVRAPAIAKAQPRALLVSLRRDAIDFTDDGAVICGEAEILPPGTIDTERLAGYL